MVKNIGTYEALKQIFLSNLEFDKLWSYMEVNYGWS